MENVERCYYGSHAWLIRYDFVFCGLVQYGVLLKNISKWQGTKNA